MAHNDNHARLPHASRAECTLQPQHAVDRKMVGRLIKQQHIRLGKQRRCKGHTHTPPARKILHIAGQEVLGEAKRHEHRTRTPLGAVCVDGDEALVHCRELEHGFCRLLALLPVGLGVELLLVAQQRLTLHVSPQHHVLRLEPLVHQRQGDLLGDVVHTKEAGQARDAARREPAKECALPLSVTPNKPVTVPRHEPQAHVLEQIVAPPRVWELKGLCL
mmetsp:Transcript_11536/g.28275  ORF Transcript_11536/g.28275 Transcript_11536/m.28275 type:complete len:218 (-) Transcript_11536:831-1484(-)